MKIVLTGGRGFIGSHMTDLLSKLAKMSNGRIGEIVVLDAHTYAARPFLMGRKPENVREVVLDIRDQLAVRKFMEEEKPDHIIHMAAESHVCRSITGPKDFVLTNVVGTWNLLEEFKEIWKGQLSGKKFLHVSTDEVFGEIKTGKFKEDSPIAPRSPYASSKAASDHLVSAYCTTYGLHGLIVNCSNNYGPNQHEEKLVPKAILRIIQNKPVDIYGNGKQVRDWLWVEDCCRAILHVLDKGIPGQRYCIGGELEMTNIELVNKIHEICTKVFAKTKFNLKLNYTNDRPTDDKRYALSTQKIRKLGWKPKKEEFDKNLQYTILWYWKRMVVGARRHSVTKDGVERHG